MRQVAGRVAAVPQKERDWVAREWRLAGAGGGAGREGWARLRPGKWQVLGIPGYAQIQGVQSFWGEYGVTRGLTMGKAIVLIYILLQPLWLLWGDWPGQGMQEATKGAVAGAQAWEAGGRSRAAGGMVRCTGAGRQMGVVCGAVSSFLPVISICLPPELSKESSLWCDNIKSAFNNSSIFHTDKASSLVWWRWHL